MSQPQPPQPPLSGPSAPGRLPLGVADLLLIVILALGASRFLIPVVLSAFGIAPTQGGADTSTILLLLTLQTLLLLAVVYLVAVRWRGGTWQDLGVWPLPDRWAWRAALIALLAFPLVNFVSWLQMRITGQPLDNPQMEVLAPDGFSWSSYLGMLLVAGVLAPIAEEVAFRGLLYRWLRERVGIGLGMLGSALAFSVLHGIAGLIPAIAVLGLILAWVYERSGSIWAPIVVHGAYNAIVTTLLYAAVAQGVKLPGAG